MAVHGAGAGDTDLRGRTELQRLARCTRSCGSLNGQCNSEGLPAVVTVTLAIGVSMARRHAIIHSCQPLKPLAVPLSSVLIKPAL